MSDKQLVRRTDNKMIAGVCSGLADYFGVDVNLVRFITVIVTLSTAFSFGVIAYALAWAFIPEAGTGKLGFDTVKQAYDERVKPTVDQTFNRPTAESGPAPTAQPTSEWEQPYRSTTVEGDVEDPR